MKRIHGLIAIASLALAVTACDHYPNTPPANGAQPTPKPTTAPHNPPNQDDCTPRPGENRTC